jgi:hypothetical protein
MPPLEIDGVVHPEEYEVRVDSATHPVKVFPIGAPIFTEVYYSFDGAALHFGIRRTLDVKVKGVSVWIDPDRNGCELGDLLVAVEPEHKLANYGIFTHPGHVHEVAGTPPDPARAGADVRCFERGDTEVKLQLRHQYANGLMNPLPDEIQVNVTVQAEDEGGREVVNYMNGAPLTTFTIAFE